ncbi:MAG TPA: hypothetical protein VF286_01390, partial [Acidiphilium sp.]
TIFDRFKAVPTYVIDYPVASSREACKTLRSFVDAGCCEIGAHLHPWVNPPTGGPIDSFHSYPGNLPPEEERAKLDALTKRIEDEFRARPGIYKAGRYGVGRATEGILLELGYKIDVSLVPHSDFSSDGGPNFGGIPAHPFVTKGGVVALPLTVTFVGHLAGMGATLYPYLTARLSHRLHAPGVAARTGLLERLRLSPEGHAASDMCRETRAALARGERFFMLTYHSSSLLPGASPYVRTTADREKFLERIERYLRFFVAECGGRMISVSDAAALLLAAVRERETARTDRAFVTAGTESRQRRQGW